MKTARLLMIMLATAALLSPGTAAQSGQQLFQQALAKEQAEGKLREAIQLYQRVVSDASADRSIKARALLQIGRCQEKLGNSEARMAYDQVVRQFADQQEAATQARERLSFLAVSAGPSAVSRSTGAVARRLNLPWGVPSPDGQYFAFGDDSELSIRVMATGEIRKIVKKSANEELEGELIWTPDSRRVVFNWWKELPNKEDRWDLRIVNIDGGGLRMLTPATPDYIEPKDCSADGALVAVTIDVADNGEEMRIGVVPVAGGAVRVLKTVHLAPATAQFADQVAFSPDGRYLGFNSALPAGTASDIFRLPLHGGTESAILQHPADDRLLAWTPDGGSILFTSDRSGSVDIWLTRVVDGRAQGIAERVKRDVGRVQPLGFTASGAFFYAVNFPSLGSGGEEIFVATIDPVSGRVVSPPAPVTQSHAGKNAAPSWSPDGRSLAYKARTDSSKPPDVITVLSIETGVERHVRPPTLGVLGLFSWHPDGRSFLVNGAVPGAAPETDGARGVFRVDTTTGAFSSLIARPADTAATQSNWIDEGRSIVFVSSERRLVVRNMESGADTTLYDAGDNMRLTSLAVSPDGQLIAFRVLEGFRPDGTPRKRAYLVIPRGGGQPRELAPHHDNRGRWGQIAWTPDGRYLYFADMTGENYAMELWRVSASGGKPQSVGITMAGTIAGLSVHPDGRRIAFHGPHVAPGTWVLENFLPGSRSGR